MTTKNKKVSSIESSVILLKDELEEVVGVVITEPSKGHIFYNVDRMGTDDIKNLFENSFASSVEEFASSVEED